MPTAIVTGATGILGRAIVHTLGSNSKQWSKVYALSRSKKEDYPSTVEHRHVDLTASASDLAKELEGVTADYLFFAAYLQEGDEQRLLELNGSMLRSFLHALEATGAAKQIKRVILVTGAKQYGLHFGRPKMPMEESDPWIEAPGRPPNFYYEQQRILAAEAKKIGYDWTVTYPNDVLGTAQGNFMNLAVTMGIYCAVTKELNGKGGELLFPGSKAFYTMFDCYTDANLHARFCEWAATSPKASNEAFNIHNGDAASWEDMWPKIAKRYGLKVPHDNLSRQAPDPNTTKLDPVPPVADLDKELGLGSGPYEQSVAEQRLDLTRWAQRKDVRAAWEKLAERDGLQKDAFDKATWGFLNFVLGRAFNIVISMDKARKAGWLEYLSSYDSLVSCLDELENMKAIPKSH